MSRVHIKREALICTNEQDALETISAFWRQPPGFENIKKIAIVKGTEEDKSFYNRGIFIFDHSTFKSHKHSSEHTLCILYVGRCFLKMEL